MKPRLLDLFCGAGGAGEGYRRAGFDVVGVDHKPQPRNPHTFVEADALEFLAEFGHEFDAIHASPPCQAHSRLAALQGKDYPCFIDATRAMLCESGKPWVIENVVGAPLNNHAMVCGSAFGLGVWRHRLFEGSFLLWGSECRHDLCPKPVDVSGTGGYCPGRVRADGKGGNSRKPRNLAEARRVMGIDWMGRLEISQAIPPAYTEWIGRQLMMVVTANAGGEGRAASARTSPPPCSQEDRT